MVSLVERLAMSHKQKILIVDDKRENLIALRQVLREIEAELVEAVSGNEALTATLDNDFALAILDVQMPQMSGYELADFLREDEKTSHIPIIFLTAHSMDEQSIFKGYESGGIDYIMKPYEAVILQGKVRQFLELDLIRRQLQEHRDRLEATVARRTEDLQREVRERLQAQQRVVHLNNVLSSIRRVNQLIVRAQESWGLIREACQVLVETRSYHCAWIMLGDPKGEPEFMTMALKNKPSIEVDLSEFKGCWPACQQEVGQAENGIAVVKPETRCPECPLEDLRESGLVIVSRLNYGEEIMGLMGVAVGEDAVVQTEERSLLQEVAGDIGFALHDIRIQGQHDLFAEIVANSQEPMALVDREYRYLKVNPSYQKMIGLPEDRIEGHDGVEVLGEEFFREQVKSHIDQCLLGETVSLESSREIPGKGRRYVEALYSPCRDQDGTVYAVAATIRDITELKNAQAALQTEIRRAQQYFEIVGVMMLVLDPKGRVVRINRRGCQILGYDEEEIRGRNWFDNFVSPQVKQEIQPLAMDLLKGQDQEATYHENPVLTKEGKERLISWHNTLIRDEAGVVIGILSSGDDITDLRTAEEALQNSAEFLTETGRMARVGGWSLTPGGKEVFWTDVTREIHEVDDDYQPSLETALEFFHEEDRTKLAAAIEAALDGGEPYDLEIRFITAKGRNLWTHTRCRPVMEQGKVVRLVGTFQDITERKRSEELLLARMRLMEFGAKLTNEEFIHKALDEICAQTHSPIGCLYLLKPDQKTLSLMAWSNRTLKEFWWAEDLGRHHTIDEGGVWWECVGQRKPIIYNDSDSIPSRKGLPSEHPEVWRGLTFPIMREEQVVAVMGVGNKDADYTENDLAVVSFLSDVAYEITTRKQAEGEREQLAAAIAQTSDIVMITDPEGVIQYVNPAFVRITGYSQQEALGRSPRLLKSGEQDQEFYREMWGTISAGRSWQGRIINKRQDGDLYIEEAHISPVLDKSGAICNYVAIKTDITDHLKLYEEKANLEKQMREAQKMESIGRLAGGVAHDFNNMLTVISGYTTIVSEQMEEHDPLRQDLEQVQDAAMRARDLTRQLLAFARRQTVSPQVIDLNEVLAKSHKMLGRLIGEDIDLKMIPCENVWPLKLDPAQIDQIIANLAVNARDAINGVGRVSIETHNIVLDKEFCSNHLNLQPGEYVLLSFSDTGMGMDRETLDKIFEPFFTTKKVGEGTGLGLSTVYGIVRQAGGLVDVHSEPDRGTTFKLYLPRCDETHTEVILEQEANKFIGNETILVVEDEAPILELCSEVLKIAGYNVLTNTKPDEALAMAQKHQDTIHLLITDVVMPSMNGKELKERLEKIKPGIKVLYMSGYTADIIAHRGVQAEGGAFLQKPFNTTDLTKMVRKVLSGD